MNALITKAALVAALVGLMLTANGCKCPLLHKRGLVIVLQPKSQFAIAGTSVTFNVIADDISSDKAPTYQWYFNGKPIEGATEDSYTIKEVKRGAAGRYTVKVTGEKDTAESGDVGLTVSEPAGNGGSLSVPLGEFTPGGGNSCFAVPFDKFTNMFFFYYLSTGQTPPVPNYPNNDNVPKITVDTLSPNNGATLDTGVLIVNHTSPSDKVCNDDFTSYAPNPKLSSATKTMTKGKKYRASIYYRGALPPGLTTITVNWIYSN